MRGEKKKREQENLKKWLYEDQEKRVKGRGK